MDDHTRTDSPWEGLAEQQPFLRAWLTRRTRDAHELEDVLQETLIRAARYRGTLASPARLRSWLLCIARNVMNDTVRRGCRLPRTASDEGEAWVEPEAREPDLLRGDGEARMAVGEDCLERDEVLEHMRWAMSELSDGDRRLLGSFYGGAGSCRETARECSIDPHLVKVRLFRARQRLARRLRTRLARRLEQERRWG